MVGGGKIEGNTRDSGRMRLKVNRGGLLGPNPLLFSRYGRLLAFGKAAALRGGRCQRRRPRKGGGSEGPPDDKAGSAALIATSLNFAAVAIDKRLDDA